MSKVKLMLRSILYITIALNMKIEAAKNQPIKGDQVGQILVMSIPKCGTNLLMKSINLLFKRNFLYIMPYSFDSKINVTYQYTYSHLPYSDQRCNNIQEANMHAFFIYRDPRDQVVSCAFHVQKHHDQKDLIHPKLQIPIHAIPVDYLIFDLITDGSWLYERWAPVSNIFNYYKLFLPWLEKSSVYTLRFEELVGPHGGGSREAQLKQIKNILSHLGLDQTEERIQFIIGNLFGSSASFREGKIGSWKKYFTPEHKRLFKAIAGQLLIDLGYEKDFNW